jgi:hypothetical protein
MDLGPVIAVFAAVGRTKKNGAQPEFRSRPVGSKKNEERNR